MSAPLTTIDQWGDIVTTTLENRSGAIADNVTNNAALLYRLEKRDNHETFSSGREIIQELSYQENDSFLWYSGADFLNVSYNDTLTAARFPIKQCAISLVMTGLEDLQNSGDEQVIDLIKARAKVMEATFTNQMTAGVYSDGTGFSGKQINGLQALVSMVPNTGIVGGLAAASLPWWRNASINANTDPRGVVTASNIQSYMTTTAIGLNRNNDGVDLFVADNNYYSAYVSSLQAIQRIMDPGNSMQSAGFTSLKFDGAGKSADVVLDGGFNGGMRTNTMYALNTNFIKYRPHARRNFKVVGGDRAPINQDAIVRIYAWAGNMTISNRSLQGVLWQ